MWRKNYRDIIKMVQCYNLSDLIKKAVLREYNDEGSVK